MSGNTGRPPRIGLVLYARLAYSTLIDLRYAKGNADTVKQERMLIRLDPLSKRKLERTAAYAHKSLSEFVLGQALHAADEVIQEHETLTLNEVDWQVILDALEKPPKAQHQTQTGLRRT